MKHKKTRLLNGNAIRNANAINGVECKRNRDFLQILLYLIKTSSWNKVAVSGYNQLSIAQHTSWLALALYCFQSDKAVVGITAHPSYTSHASQSFFTLQYLCFQPCLLVLCPLEFISSQKLDEKQEICWLWSYCTHQLSYINISTAI